MFTFGDLRIQEIFHMFERILKINIYGLEREEIKIDDKLFETANNLTKKINEKIRNQSIKIIYFFKIRKIKICMVDLKIIIIVSLMQNLTFIIFSLKFSLLKNLTIIFFYKTQTP